MAKSVVGVGGSVLALITVVSTFPVMAVSHKWTNAKGPRQIFAAPSGKFVAAIGIDAPLFRLFNNFGTEQRGRYACCNAATISSTQSVAMPFTPAFGATVSKVVVAVSHVSGTNAVALSLNEDSGGLPGDAIEGFVLSDLPGFGSCCKVKTANTTIPVSAGLQYWIVVAPADGATNAGWNFNVTNQTPQPCAYTDNGVWRLANCILSAFAVQGELTN